jgi:hypothetical protein
VQIVPVDMIAPVSGGKARIIEYEIRAPSESKWLNSLADPLRRRLGRLPEVGILRCVSEDGEAITLVGDAEYTRTILTNGVASDPSGVELPKEKFPVSLDGWPYRLESA